MRKQACLAILVGVFALLILVPSFSVWGLVGDLFKHTAASSVMGFQTKSDLTQLAELTGLPAAVVMLLLLALQAALLIYVIRWTCNAGTRAALQRESLIKKLVRSRRRELRQIRGPELY